MRRPPRTSVFVAALLVAGVAIAGTEVYTSNADWSSGTFTNVDNTGNDLTIQTVDDLVDDWYRRTWDDADFEGQAQKDDNVVFAEADRCLRDADNAGIDGPVTSIHSHDFRTGTAVKNVSGTNYVATIPAGTTIPLPTTLTSVDSVRFLIGGARIAATNVTVRFHYAGGTSGDVVVPIAVDTVTGAARDAVGPDYDIEGVNGVVFNANPSWDADASGASDCAGAGADDVIAYNPQPLTDVTDVEFLYTDFADANAASGWVGGPVALSVITTEADYDATWTYRGTWSSPVATTTATDAGQHALWYQVDFNGTFPGASEAFLHLSCGDDDDNDGTLEASELSVEETYALSTQPAPFTLPTPCAGRYLRYRIELVNPFADAPDLDDISFSWDPDADGDGFGDDGNATANDCNDGNASIKPGAAEITGDGVDQNCDGVEDCFVDNDNDNAHTTVVDVGGTNNDADCNDANEGKSSEAIDCNDADAAINPSASEVAGDNVDQNCDGIADCFTDLDNDGARTAVVDVGGSNDDADCNDANEGLTADAIDCNDNDAAVNPGAAEVAGNNVDENCNGAVDCWTDADNDGARTAVADPGGSNNDANCNDTNEGVDADPIDCNDASSAVFPGATEITGDNVDQNCDGVEDCWTDGDDDGARTAVVNPGGDNNDADCNDAREGVTADAIDCNDASSAVRPGVAEIAGDNVDQNCDSSEDCYVDNDNDNARTTVVDPGGINGDLDCNDANEGLAADPIDCNDNSSSINPAAAEVPGDGTDQNCDGVEDCFVDADNDGARTTATDVGGSNNDADCNDANEGVTADLIDCNDAVSTINPSAVEVVGDNVDQNCNGIEDCYTDADNDGDRTTVVDLDGTNSDADCNDANEALVSDAIDCNDADPLVNGGSTEIAGNGVDEDCNGNVLCYTDADNDGARTNVTFGTSPGDLNCTDAFEGVSSDPIDCNDTNLNIKPGVAELPGDNVDQNCDTVEDCYTDADNDGSRTAVVVVGGLNNDADCSDANEGVTGDSIDCNDGNNTIFPGAVEGTGDNVDQNCDGIEDCWTDADNDGARTTVVNPGGDNGDADCNDANEAVTGDAVDCNDGQAAIKPGVAELVGDGVDQNCDGVEDCYLDSDNDNDRSTTTDVGGTNNDADCDDSQESYGTAAVDCADTDATRFSTNSDLTIAANIGNGVDNDCNGGEICYVDADNDNSRTGATVVSADVDCSDAGEDLASAPLDCNDLDSTSSPLLSEVTGNGVDNDCNGGEICWLDNDDDDYRNNASTTIASTDADCADSREALTAAGIDCDDNRALTNPGAPDVCGNGIDDNCDGLGNSVFGGPFTDDDDDGLTYSEEQALGTNDCDSDSDDDGLADDVEDSLTGTDPADADTDGDGANDGVEVGANPASPINTDGTDQHDALDPDDDNDGIPSLNEDVNGDGNPRNDQSDADGIPDCLDSDDDNDGILTINENWDGSGDARTENSDGDLLPDYRDNDDDNDGILTANENWNGTGDARDDNTDGTDTPDYRDADDDNDTVLTINENVNGVGDARDDNTDSATGDLLPNYRDTDDDGDGILTSFEYSDAPLEADRDNDNDGLQNHVDLDSDGDGYTDQVEGRVSSDSPSDGIYDYLDSDSDNDTVADLSEVNEDFDGDGRRNRVDSDDDGDGILTSQEQADALGDADGFPNYRDLDSDGDNWSDDYEWTVLKTDTDEDNDGRNNYVDTDSDGDSILDDDELGSEAATVDSDGDGDENRLDSDDDDDCVATIDEVGGGAPANWEDMDGDGVANYLDTDDDDDGEDTCSESPDGDANPADDDTDGDTIPNFLDDDDDNDGIPTVVELSQSGGRNVDADLLENHLDLDSDNDGWNDAHEAPGGVLVNTDGDARVDFLDTDSDNDTVVDANEGSSTNQLDTDGDGLKDRVDTDDDNDLIPTLEECSEACGDGNPMNDNWDNDAVADYLDPDDDNDRVPTRDEDVDGSGDPRDDNTDANYQNPDALPDWLDTDDDGDGLLTLDEDPNGNLQPLDDHTDADGTPDYRDEDDDGDALFTFDETLRHDTGAGSNDPRAYDWDGDGVANYRDADDDDDGVDTFCEISFGVSHLGVDGDGDGILDGAEWYNFIYLDDPTNPDGFDFGGGVTGTSCLLPWDRDADGTINALDADDDGDGFITGDTENLQDLDCIAGTAVPAGDGVPAYLDFDSDNDGLVDDFDGRFYPDGEGLDDQDGDQIDDFLDCDSQGALGDSDADGIINGDETILCEDLGLDPQDCLLDPDVDDDMVIDGVEAGSDLANPLDTDGDGTPDLVDTDDDDDSRTSASENDPLVLDCTTPIKHEYSLLGGYWYFSCVTPSTTPAMPQVFDFGGNDLADYPNHDAPGRALVQTPDAIPDFRDPDDDGDGRPTVVEGDGDDDGDSVVNWEDPYDFDGPLADPDEDGLTTEEEGAIDPGLDPYDDDTDDDGVSDLVEIGDPANPTDSDGDGAIDAVDPDDDGDGIDTAIEGTNDLDGDGVPNHLDDDSDGDGKLDADEGADADVDCDGIWNALDADDANGPCMDDGTPLEGDEYVRSGCSCATDGSAGGLGWLALGGLVLALRRRR